MLIERFVSSREPRLMSQALRFVGPLRKAGKESPSKMVAALTAASPVVGGIGPVCAAERALGGLLGDRPQLDRLQLKL